MNQLELQRTMFDGVAHLYAEFGNSLRSGELAAFLLVASHPNISVAEIASRLGVSRKRAIELLTPLCPRERWWQRRYGLVQLYVDEKDASVLHCVPTLKGALVARGAFLKARLDAQIAAPPPGSG